MIELGGRQIESISVVDDDESARDGYGEPIEELELAPVPQRGPLWSVEDVKAILRASSQAALCDHHLKKRNYARFNGSTLVAACYDDGFPAVLCTRYDKASQSEIRRDRRKIPVVLSPSDVNPDAIQRAILKVILEMRGNFAPDRRPWRQQVRIDEVTEEGGNSACYVVVPGWRRDEVIRLQFDEFPSRVLEAIRGGAQRVHAEVNIGAEAQEELYFAEWEPE